MGEPYTIMKYKVKAIIKGVTMGPMGPEIDQEIVSVRRNILDDIKQRIFTRASETETITHPKETMEHK
jgi:hypothetical protein